MPAIGYLTSDSSVIVMMRDSIQKVNAHVVADSIAIMDTLHYYYATNAHLNDTLGHYTTSNQVDTLLNAYEKKADLCKDVIGCIGDTLSKYTTTNQIDTLLGDYVTNAHLNDTLSHYYDTTLMKKAIHDTANVLRGQIPVVNNGQITIKVNNQGTEEVNTFGVNQANDQLITITIPTEVAVNNGQLTIIAKDDTTRFTANQAINDTVDLSGFATIALLNDTLKAYTTTNKIDTLIKKYGYLTSDSAVIVMMRDSIQKVNAHVVADSLTIMDTLHRYYATNDTLNNYYTRYQVDTAKANIRNEIQNGTLTITYGSTVTTFTANQATGDNVSVTIPTPEEQVQADWKETDALKTSYIRNKPNIRDSVNRVVLDSLYAANSAMNKAMDTIAGHNIHDSLTVVRTKIYADSTALATRMDSPVLQDGLEDVGPHYC